MLSRFYPATDPSRKLAPFKSGRKFPLTLKAASSEVLISPVFDSTIRYKAFFVADFIQLTRGKPDKGFVDTRRNGVRSQRGEDPEFDMTGLNVDELYPLSVDEDIPDEALAVDLIAFNMEGSRLPLFLIQTWDEEIFHIQRLARCLGPDQPIFSLNPPRGQRREDFPRRDSTWSQYALERIDRLGHTGPWRIGGWSFGGALSLRIAKTLLGRGEQIESVILFDAVFPGLSRSSNRKRKKNPIHRIASGVNNYYDLPPEARKKVFDQTLAGWKRRLSGREKKWRTERKTQMGLLQRAIHVAFLNYEEIEFEGPVALFWTDETMKKTNDLSLGWHRYLKGSFFSQSVAEGHVEMWHEPHIERVAEACKIFLAREKPADQALIP